MKRPSTLQLALIATFSFSSLALFAGDFPAREFHGMEGDLHFPITVSTSPICEQPEARLPRALERLRSQTLTTLTPVGARRSHSIQIVSSPEGHRLNIENTGEFDLRACLVGGKTIVEVSLQATADPASNPIQVWRAYSLDRVQYQWQGMDQNCVTTQLTPLQINVVQTQSAELFSCPYLDQLGPWTANQTATCNVPELLLQAYDANDVERALPSAFVWNVSQPQGISLMTNSELRCVLRRE